MPRLLVWGIAIAVVTAILDRVLLWTETRGWVYYRRTKARGGGSVYHMLELHSVFDPGIEQIQEIKVEEERRQDVSGDPPAPEDPDGPRSGESELR